jgi:hypothetical protein
LCPALVSDYQKFKFGGPIFDLLILLKSDISILFSVSIEYQKIDKSIGSVSYVPL